jgi:hypothetical protein
MHYPNLDNRARLKFRYMVFSWLRVEEKSVENKTRKSDDKQLT